MGPGSHPFEIWHPVSYVLLYAGNTEPLVYAVPLPSTIALLPAAGLAWLISAARLRHTIILRVLGVALSVLVTTSLAQASPQLTISSLQKTGEKRINRTVYEYTFKTSVTNAGQAPEKNVTAELIKAGDGTDIISGVIAAGDIAAGATVHPAGTLVVRHDRTFPFSLTSLSWAVEAEPSAMLDDLDHAEVYVIPLAELGISLPAISVSATGAVSEARIVDGSLRFWTPGDPGRDEYGDFLVHTGLGITSLTALIRSQRPPRAATVIEAMENGELPAPRPRLNVEGLGANNSLTGGPLTFRLASNPGGDFKDDSRAELVAAGNSVIALQDYWTYNPADASFTIDTPAMAEILTRLAPGTSSMSVNFVSKDGEFAAVYELLVLRPSASLNGRFISQDGEPVATLSGMHVLLKGYAGGLRKTAVIGSDGRFTFEGLVPDTYQLTLSDLANPNATTASTAVFLDSTNVDVSIVYAKPSAGKAGSQKLVPGRSHGSKSSQDGTPPSRSAADRVIARESLPSAGQPGEKSLPPPLPARPHPSHPGSESCHASPWQPGQD